MLARHTGSSEAGMLRLLTMSAMMLARSLSGVENRGLLLTSGSLGLQRSGFNVF